MRPVLLVMVIGVLGLAPASASAQRAGCQAPPGTSAIDQYCEVVPDGAGGSSTGGSGPKTPGLSPSSQKALSRQGADGDAVVSLAQSTADSSSTPAPAHKPQGNHAPADQTQKPRDSSHSTHSTNGVLQAAASSASQETGRIGGAFVVVLLMAMIAMGGWGWHKFRRSNVT